MDACSTANLRPGTRIFYDGTVGVVRSVLQDFVRIDWEDNVESSLPVDDMDEVEILKEKL